MSDGILFYSKGNSAVTKSKTNKKPLLLLILSCIQVINNWYYLFLGESSLEFFRRDYCISVLYAGFSVNGRKPAYWYRYGRNDKIQRDAFVNASPWIHYFGYYHHIIVRLAMLSGAL